jgi:hypothetical protein
VVDSVLKYCVLILVTGAAAIATRPGTCFFANSRENSSSSGCTNDPLSFASDKSIVAAEESLALDRRDIVWFGCQHGGFSVRQEGESTRYKIEYPVGEGGGHDLFLAPAVHELAHIFQMRIAGGQDELLKQFTSMRIELGADFLTGVIYENYLKQETAIDFQGNLQVMGVYLERENIAHGSPEQRVGAFRFGRNEPLAPTADPLRSAHRKFQSQYFGRVIGLR